ncbi:MAG: hypothetical protein ACHQFW_10870 [Chitinophagales bacterium]
MRKNVFAAGFISMAILIASSCKNNEIPDYDIDFTFVEPASGLVLNSGDELHMEIDVQGTAPINNIEVLVINTTSGDTIGNFPVSTNEQFYPFHEHLVVTAGVTSACKVVANAWASNYAERITKEVPFTINP